MNYSTHLIHLLHGLYETHCGADNIALMTSNVKDVTCPCCLGDHKWTGKKSNAPSEPDDYYEYCAICGVENQGSFVE